MRVFGPLFQFVDARDLRVERARADQAHRPGDVDGVMRLARLLIGESEGGEGGRRLSVSHIASIAASFIFWEWVAE
jgi:hypothetical protein